MPQPAFQPWTSTLRRLPAIALVISLAFAQDGRHHDPHAGISFPVPIGWTISETVGDGGELTFELSSGDGDGTLVIVRTPTPPAAMDALRGQGPESVEEAWSGFAEEVAGARAERVGERTVAGRTVGRVDYTASGFRGALLSLIGDDAVFTIVSITSDAHYAATDAALSELLDGLELLGTAPPNPLADAAAANPLANPPGANPLAAAPGANPLAPPPGTNPLAPAPSANPLAPPPGTNPLAAATSPPLAPPPPDRSRADASATPGRYFEPFTGTDPDLVFGGVLDVGKSDGWTGTLAGNGYVLRNDDDPSAVLYYFANTLPGVPRPLSLAQVGIDVQLVPGSELAAAGLLFDFDADTGSYLAFTLTEHGYAILQRAESGLSLLVDEPHEVVVTGGVNRLELRPQVDRVAMLVNGQQIITLESGSGFAGGIGIVAVGSGTFTFRDLEVVAP